MEKELCFAVLIDAENFSSKYAEQLFDAIGESGYASIRRIYGDVNSNQMRPWKEVARTHSITSRLEHCYSVKKNASDCALIIDAMDILHSGKVDGFWIASSDGDFRNLAIRIREEGMKIFGAGEQKTPKAFMNSCEKFVYVDTLIGVIADMPTEPEKTNASEAVGLTPTEPEKTNAGETVGFTPITTVKREVIRILDSRERQGRERSATLSSIGGCLCKKFPEFSPWNYGYKKLQQLFESFAEFEIEEDPSEKDPKVKVVYITLKDSNAN